MRLEGKKVLVTGGAGFIGSHLVDKLVNMGCQVRVFDTVTRGFEENLSHQMNNPAVTLAIGNILDPFDVAGILDDIEVVFHLTGLGARHCINHPLETNRINTEGAAFISVNDNDKVKAMPIARQLYDLGFSLLATEGTFKALKIEGIPARMLYKVGRGRPNAVDLIINGEIQLVINTPLGKIARADESNIGRTALANNVPCLTTLSAAWAMVQAIRSLKYEELGVIALQD